MPDYRLTSDAQADLIEIRRYNLKHWGSSQSQKYLSELRQTICLLAENPTLGEIRPEVALGFFSFSYVSHVIYYVVYDHQLIVFGGLHKRMVPLNHLAEREMV